MKAALVQLNASDDPAANLPVTAGFIRQAAADGADDSADVVGVARHRGRRRQPVAADGDAARTAKPSDVVDVNVGPRRSRSRRQWRRKGGALKEATVEVDI